MFTGGADARAPPTLRIEALHKSFGELEVLQAASTSTVAEHEVVCLIGASGSGKSTLLRCINLLEPIDDGRILLAGEEITAPGVDVDAHPPPTSASSSRPSTCSRT